MASQLSSQASSPPDRPVPMERGASNVSGVDLKLLQLERSPWAELRHLVNNRWFYQNWGRTKAPQNQDDDSAAVVGRIESGISRSEMRGSFARISGNVLTTEYLTAFLLERLKESGAVEESQRPGKLPQRFESTSSMSSAASFGFMPGAKMSLDVPTILNRSEDNLEKWPPPGAQNLRFLLVALLHSNHLREIPTRACWLWQAKTLRKLDLHNNSISTLPSKESWKNLPNLEVLYLHKNWIAAHGYIEELAVCTKLQILTVYDNPIALNHDYRQKTINALKSLQMLDWYVVSDTEVIGSVSLGTWWTDSRFQPRTGYLRVPPVVDPDATAKPPKGVREDEWLIRGLDLELYLVEMFLLSGSAVCTIQRYVRGWLWRKWVKKEKERREQAARVIQNKFLRKMRRVTIACVKIQRLWREVVLRRNRAAMMLQSKFRQIRLKKSVATVKLQREERERRKKLEGAVLTIQRAYRVHRMRNAMGALRDLEACRDNDANEYLSSSESDAGLVDAGDWSGDEDYVKKFQIEEERRLQEELEERERLEKEERERMEREKAEAKERRRQRKAEKERKREEQRKAKEIKAAERREREEAERLAALEREGEKEKKRVTIQTPRGSHPILPGHSPTPGDTGSDGERERERERDSVQSDSVVGSFPSTVSEISEDSVESEDIDIDATVDEQTLQPSVDTSPSLTEDEMALGDKIRQLGGEVRPLRESIRALEDRIHSVLAREEVETKRAGHKSGGVEKILNPISELHLFHEALTGPESALSLPRREKSAVKYVRNTAVPAKYERRPLVSSPTRSSSRTALHTPLSPSLPVLPPQEREREREMERERERERESYGGRRSGMEDTAGLRLPALPQQKRKLQDTLASSSGWKPRAKSKPFTTDLRTRGGISIVTGGSVAVSGPGMGRTQLARDREEGIHSTVETRANAVRLSTLAHKHQSAIDEGENDEDIQHTETGKLRFRHAYGGDDEEREREREREEGGTGGEFDNGYLPDEYSDVQPWRASTRPISSAWTRSSRGESRQRIHHELNVRRETVRSTYEAERDAVENALAYAARKKELEQAAAVAKVQAFRQQKAVKQQMRKNMEQWSQHRAIIERYQK